MNLTRFITYSLVFIGLVTVLPWMKKDKAHAKTFQLNASQSEGNFQPSNVGVIGVKYLHQRGASSEVIEVYPGTPAANAGVQVGDRILKVDGRNVSSFDSEGVYSLIAGYPGDPISLNLERCSYRGQCYNYSINIKRMDMNQIASQNVFNIYRYGF